MMQPKSRKERVAEYGSFLLCPERGVWCSEMDNDDGICRQEWCYEDRPDYLAEQERIKRNMQENVRREKEEREAAKNEPPAPIRRQIKTDVQLLEEQIERKEEKARRLYQANKPRAADSVIREVMALRGRLRKMKGA